MYIIMTSPTVTFHQRILSIPSFNFVSWCVTTFPAFSISRCFYVVISFVDSFHPSDILTIKIIETLMTICFNSVLIVIFTKPIVHYLNCMSDYSPKSDDDDDNNNNDNNNNNGRIKEQRSKLNLWVSPKTVWRFGQKWSSSNQLDLYVTF